MKCSHALLAAALLTTGIARAKEAAPRYQLSVDVVFALDATGSMGGEIHAAKEKIRSIAREIVEQEKGEDTEAKVRFGVIAYRDKGDTPEQQVLPLTGDIDAVYTFLLGIQASGGGDGPENVRQALKSAVGEMAWSGHDDAVKMIFLVGDAPPHQDYPELPSCMQSAEKAAKRNISISTIACGGLAGPGRALWKQIADATYGNFEQLPRSGGGFGGPGGGFAAKGLRLEAATTRGVAMPSAAPMDGLGGAADDDSADRFSSIVVDSVRRKTAEARRKRR